MSDRLRRAFERAEDELINADREGLISPDHFRWEHRNLVRDYRETMEEAADLARKQKREDWPETEDEEQV